MHCASVRRIRCRIFQWCKRTSKNDVHRQHAWKRERQIAKLPRKTGVRGMISETKMVEWHLNSEKLIEKEKQFDLFYTKIYNTFKRKILKTGLKTWWLFSDELESIKHKKHFSLSHDLSPVMFAEKVSIWEEPSPTTYLPESMNKVTVVIVVNSRHPYR